MLHNIMLPHDYAVTTHYARACDGPPLHPLLNMPLYMDGQFGVLEWRLHQCPCSLAVPRFQGVN